MTFKKKQKTLCYSFENFALLLLSNSKISVVRHKFIRFIFTKIEECTHAVFMCLIHINVCVFVIKLYDIFRSLSCPVAALQSL